MTAPRRIAAQILHQVETTEQTLDRCLEMATPRIDALNRADRSLLHALVYGVLRWKKRLDWIIDQWARKPGKIEPMVRIVLRIGIYQLFFMDRIPKPAAVHSAVELVKSEGFQWAAGFVNGILRKAASGEQPPLPSLENDPIQKIALEHSIPNWLAERWLQRFGAGETGSLCRAINIIPTITLRVNTLRATREELLRRMSNDAHNPQATRYSPEGIRFSAPLQPLVSWPAFSEGCFQVQDEAAQLISHMLHPQPGEIVWDVCAGLGTKTAHLGQLMQNRGAIWATDIGETKLRSLHMEMQRLGVTIVSTQVLDAAADSTMTQGRLFDRILVDAPCTGLGVLQKNPDGKWRRKPSDFERYRSRQSALLNAAAGRLKSGGMLVYAVCSFEPEETTNIVEDFLAAHADFTLVRPGMPSVSEIDLLISSEGYLATLPHRHGMDGFFAAALQRR